MNKNDFEDENHFGVKVIVYCASHMRPHFTGWCTVPNSEKVQLDAIDLNSAYPECREKGYDLYGETENTK
jgi:hypothetical protein